MERPARPRGELAARIPGQVRIAGRGVTYHYDGAGGIDDILSRLTRIADEDDETTYAAYTYLGAGSIVQVDHPAVGTGTYGLTLSYDPDGDHTYAAWDRFGRIIQQTWTVDEEAVDSYLYEYDMNSNRLTRENVLNEDLNEAYTYDGLDRLLTMDRDEDFHQDWTLDTLGNWSSFDDDGQEQERTNDEANQITGISGSGGANWVDPGYDAAGSMTIAPRPGQESTACEALLLVYDGWNRLVKAYKDDGETVRVIDASDTLLATYEFDGQGRRIEKTVGETATHYFFNENWQVVETRVGADPDPLDQYVWDVRYIDAPVVRFHNGNTDEDYDDPEDNTLYYAQDANWNVTAVVDEATGAVVERYMYAAYGERTVLEPDWDPVQNNESAVANERLFTGSALDSETGLYSSRVRDTYHPTLGRWLERDPAGYVEGMNLYQYVSSNPANLTDPMGLCPDNSIAPLPGQDMTITGPGAAGNLGLTGNWRDPTEEGYVMP
jgi:RHS repeat-associated protein